MLQRQTLILILGVLIVVVVGAVIFFDGQTEKVAEVPASGETLPPVEEPTAVPEAEPASGAAPQPAQAPVAPKPSQTTAAPKPTQNIITILSPQAGEKLVIGQTHTIKWSKESGFKGFIYLVNSATKEIVGWINSETGPHDTSYAWDTRYVFAGRYNATKIPVAVGKYTIGIGFESKQPSVTSGAFDIIYQSQLAIENYDVSIQNYTMSPVQLTVKKGSKLIFVNRDPVKHVIRTSGIVFPIEPSQTYTFDTAVLFPGLHEFYSEQYSTTVRISVSVQ